MAATAIEGLERIINYIIVFVYCALGIGESIIKYAL